MCHPERERCIVNNAAPSRSFVEVAAIYRRRPTQNRRAKSKDFARKESPLSLNRPSKTKVTFNTKKSIRTVLISRFGRRNELRGGRDVCEKRSF